MQIAFVWDSAKVREERQKGRRSEVGEFVELKGKRFFFAKYNRKIVRENKQNKDRFCEIEKISWAKKREKQQEKEGELYKEKDSKRERERVTQ